MKIYIPHLDENIIDLFIDPKTRTRSFKKFCNSMNITDYKSFAYIRCRKGTLKGVKNLNLVEIISTFCPAHNDFVKVDYTGKTFWHTHTKSRTFNLALNQVIEDSTKFFKTVLSSDNKGFFYYHQKDIESNVTSYFQELKSPAVLTRPWFLNVIKQITGEEALPKNISFFKREPEAIDHKFVHIPDMDLVYNFSKILLRYRSNSDEKFLKYIDINFLSSNYQIVYDDRTSEASKIICRYAETFDYLKIRTNIFGT